MENGGGSENELLRVREEKKKRKYSIVGSVKNVLRDNIRS